MHLVRLGHRVLNLRYLILAEDCVGEPDPKTLPPGTIRVTIETGRVIDLDGDDADRLRGFLEDLLAPHVSLTRHASVDTPRPPRGKRPGKRLGKR